MTKHPTNLVLRRDWTAVEKAMPLRCRSKDCTLIEESPRDTGVAPNRIVRACALTLALAGAWCSSQARSADAPTVPDPGEVLRSGIESCEVIVPTGEYAAVVLEFSLPDERGKTATWTYAGGMRAGRIRLDDGIGLREPGGWLRCADGRLRGAFRYVPVGDGLVVDATVQAGAVSGTLSLGKRRGRVKGRLIPEAELATANAVSRQVSWPAAQGPHANGCSATPTGVATVDDLAELRMVWRCEEGDIGRGMGNIDRFMITWKSAISRRTGSGCASALVADGRLFFRYFVPAPRGAATPEKPIQCYHNVTESRAAATMREEMRAALTTAHRPAPGPSPDLDDDTEGAPAGDSADRAPKPAAEPLPSYAVEKTFQCADEIMLCMDAATGKTLWKAIVRGRGDNYQHHKAGPFDMSPACGVGRVFALGTSGWIYAFDATDGRPLWEARSEVDLSNALLAAGDILVAPAGGQWGGYDTATGKLLWKAGGGRAMSTLSAWPHGGKHYLIGIMGPNHARTGLACLDAVTGRELWRLPVNVLTGGRGLGPGGISVIGDRLLVYQNDGGAARGDRIVPALAAYALSLAGAEPLWKITDRVDGLGPGEDSGGGGYGCAHNESVPVVVRGKYVFTPDLRVADCATGKVLGQAKGPIPRNGGYMQAMEDIVLVRVDGTHGGLDCGFYKIADGGSVRSLTESGWAPPVGGSTTSYHHPIFYPMADGRVFLRQDNGVYCWDMRKAGEHP